MTNPRDDALESATRPQDASGRQYHIGLGPGDVAPNVVLVGDPARAERFGARLENPRSFRQREYVTVTGEIDGLELSFLATGIGCDNTEIAIVELAQILPADPVLVRAGTCGALQENIELGDLIVTWGAVRLESTSTTFVPEGYPAVAHPEVALALRRAAESAGVRHHFGMTATAPGFYAAQGRAVAPFSTRMPTITDELAAIGVMNLEMEASTLLTLAALAGYRAGAVCVAFAERGRDRFVAPSEKSTFEDRAVECAIDAIRTLRRAT